MIFDKLENLENYANVHPRFAAAIPFLKGLIAKNPENGRYNMLDCDVAGAVYANVNSYQTNLLSDSSKMETHRKYIDIQIILEGEENIYLPGTETALTVTKEYDGERDYELTAMPCIDSTVRLTMPAGSFAIFFAGEPHAPNHAVNESVFVRKIVGKVMQ